MTVWGADAEALEALAQQMDRDADRLEYMRVAIAHHVQSTAWQGRDAAEFRNRWTTDYMRRLQNASSFLRGTGNQLRNNAQQQRQASAANGGVHSGASIGGFGSVRPAPGANVLPHTMPSMYRPDFMDSALDRIRAIDERILGSYGSVSGFLGYVPGGIGEAAGFYSDLSDLDAIRDDFVAGRHVDGVIGSGLFVSDQVADGMKHSKNPVLYLGGVALDTWTMAAEEATKVDWSAKGMQQIADASLSDWASAFGEAAKSMPLKIADAVKWW
jgi:hypothetical protein